MVSVGINKSGTKFPSVVSLCYCGVNTTQCGSLLRTANKRCIFQIAVIVCFTLVINYALSIISSCSTENNETVPLREILALKTCLYRKDFNSVYKLHVLISTSHFLLLTGDPFKDDPFGKIGEQLCNF